MSQILQNLQIWRQQLNPIVATPAKLRSPFNLVASSPTGTTGILLQWNSVRGADGYVIEYSTNGDFGAGNVLAKITNGAQTAYFDDLNASGVKRWYRITTTSGTVSAPQSVLGNTSAPVSATSGSGTTSYDNTSGTSGNDGWNRPINTGGHREVL